MYQFLTFLAQIISRLPLPLLDLFARILAFLAFDILRIRRKLVIKNLQIAFGSEKSLSELTKIGRASYHNFCLSLLEFFYSYNHHPAESTTIRNKEVLHKILARGQGAYVLCIHMSNWEALGASCAKEFGPIYFTAKKVGRPPVDNFINDLRRKRDFYAITPKKKGDGFKAIKKALGEGKLLGFVIDQARPGEPKLPFFGKPAKTNTSFAAIWKRHKAPIVPINIFRRGVFNFEIVPLPEIILEEKGDDKAEIIEYSKLFNQTVEEMVKANPEQYLWLHNRWK